MTIKALHGGKLLCLMAAVAGAMTLGSCKDDEDEPQPAPAPTPAPVDTTPAKVIKPDVFTYRLKNATKDDTLHTGDTIKANTLLVNGVNSDTISVDVILGNEKVDSALVSFKFDNLFLPKVNVANGRITDSIYSVTFPAIEGSYSLSINGKTRNFVVAGTGKELSKQGRSLSNAFTMKFDEKVNSNLGITFVPYNAAEDTGARLTGTGKFITISEEDYNTFIKATSLSTISDFIEDAEPVDGKLMLKNAKCFIYISNGNNYVINITKFAGSDVETSDLEMTVTY